MSDDASGTICASRMPGIRLHRSLTLQSYVAILLRQSILGPTIQYSPSVTEHHGVLSGRHLAGELGELGEQLVHDRRIKLRT